MARFKDDTVEHKKASRIRPQIGSSFGRTLKTLNSLNQEFSRFKNKVLPHQ